MTAIEKYQEELRAVNRAHIALGRLEIDQLNARLLGLGPRRHGTCCVCGTPIQTDKLPGDKSYCKTHSPQRCANKEKGE